MDEISAKLMKQSGWNQICRIISGIILENFKMGLIPSKGINQVLKKSSE